MELSFKSSYKVGFISPPGWFDISPMDFLGIAPQKTIVMQTLMRPPEFDYSVAQLMGSVPELKLCFDSLAGTGADVVAQFGYPFSLVHGWEKARQIQNEIQGNGHTKFRMMGVEMINALRFLNANSIAIASTYYSRKMSDILHHYLKEANVSIVYSENWQEQGILTEKESSSFIGEGELDPMNWKTPINTVRESVKSVAVKAPKADCILVVGGGMRLLNEVETLESAVGKTVISGDIILYWSILRALGIKYSIAGQGKLLACLS
ncbi:MAG: hypothetical protein ACRKGH_01215 [Dehalogenimonas sp.]